MEDTYQNAFFRILDRARNNLDHSISSLEIAEILLEERNRMLIKDQADMHGIDLDTVDIAPAG